MPPPRKQCNTSHTHHTHTTHTYTHHTYTPHITQADVDVQPNPEEVDAVQYVTLGELQHMMRPESDLKWSPWFRIIAEHFLEEWWSDLDAILTGQRDALDLKVHKIM